MALSWGQKAEIKEEILEDLAQDRASVKAQKRINAEQAIEIDSRVKVVNANLDARESVFATEKNTHEKVKAITASVDEAQKVLEAKKLEVTNAQLEIDKADIAHREAVVDKLLSEKDRAHIAHTEVVRMEERTTAASNGLALANRVAIAEAVASSKDTIIESQKGEIARLDELLKVTMGKLTQVDLKGITIHVEAAKAADKDSQPEQKQN